MHRPNKNFLERSFSDIRSDDHSSLQWRSATFGHCPCATAHTVILGAQSYLSNFWPRNYQGIVDADPQFGDAYFLFFHFFFLIFAQPLSCTEACVFARNGIALCMTQKHAGTCMHAYTPTCPPTCPPTCLPPCLHTDMHTYIHARMHA